MTDSNNIFSKKNQYRKKDSTEGLTEEVAINVGVLVRVSSDMQVVDGDSLEMQQELAQEHADKIEGTIYKFYIEEAVSASKVRIEKREKVQELKKDIIEGKVNYVIAYKRDRMFRNSIEHMQFLQFLVDHDCGLYLTARGEVQIEMMQFKVPGAAKMLESLLSMMAEMESATTAARVSDTFISKAFKGERTGGRVPVGYTVENGNFIPIEGAKEIIGKIEDLYLTGYGLKSISKWLNGGEVRGLKTLETPYPKPSIYSKTKEWNERNIKTILFNPIYTGHNSYQSRLNSEMDRIVEPSAQVTPLRTIERQQEIFELQAKKTGENKPARAYNTPFLLTGLISCAECGRLLKTQTSQNKDGVRYSYYKCGHTTTDKAKQCKMSKIYRKEILEEIILKEAKEKLVDFLDSDVEKFYYNKMQKDRAVGMNHAEKISKRIEQLTEQLKNASNTITQLTEKDKDLKRFWLSEQTRFLSELNDSKEAYLKLNEELAEEDEQKNSFEDFLKMAENFSVIMDSASMGVQKQILEKLFNGIFIDKKGEIIIDFRFGMNNREKIEKVVNTVLDDSQPNIPSFISLETIRDWMGVKDINVSSDVESLDTSSFDGIWLSRCNYYETIKNMFEQARISFYPYLYHLNPKLNFNNVDTINEAELLNYVAPPQHSRRVTKKFNTYFEQKLGVTKTTRRRIMDGHLPPLEKMNLCLAKLNADLPTFFAYVKSQYPTCFLTELNFEELEAAIKSRAVKTDYLFTDLIKCNKCGNPYIGKAVGNGVMYLCIKNRNDAGNKICSSPKIKESTLIDIFESETGEKIKKNLLVNNVDYITVLESDKALINWATSNIIAKREMVTT